MLATKTLDELPAVEIKAVRDALAALRCPTYIDSVWAAPFDQLTAAAYALLEAEHHGYSHHDRRRFQFHAHVREQVAAWIAGTAFPQHASDHDAMDEMVSGFYFNSAAQRLVWISERLVTLFAATPCPCGRKPEVSCDTSPAPTFFEFWQGASRRMDHMAFEHRRDLLHFGLLVLQLAPDRHSREADFNPEMVLAMLRFAVKHRKPTLHAWERRSDGHGARLTWSTASPSLQMKSLCDGFALLCRAYNELLDWNSEARQSAPVALGDFA